MNCVIVAKDKDGPMPCVYSDVLKLIGHGSEFFFRSDKRKVMRISYFLHFLSLR